jgi:hypothetical protein
MALRALGCRGDDGVAGSGRTTALRARGRRESMVSWAQECRWGHNIVGSGRTTSLLAQERHRKLGDGTYVVDGVTGSGRGRWQRVKGLDRGRQ